MKIEVIADSLEDAFIAEKAGADRIELVAGMLEGGLTPSYGIIQQVCQALTIPVQVMIRPHSRGFVYSSKDLQVMIKDIEQCKKLGATGVVIGVLNESGKIDEGALQELLHASVGLDVTFHRALDESRDLFEAMEVLQQYPQIRRVLTSGGKDTAIKAVNEFRTMQKQVGHKGPTLMAGAGLSLDNISEFLAAFPAKEIHFGKAVRHDSSYEKPIDTERIKKLKSLVKSS
ncbi:copper homeostasis protein CutC [Radiobacillus kanasensis]|uniref:copper homeostasis protein CutC n=1 Tax=Radiobacillus kanasensis TaxID=2844358 RepID=UPI001E4BB5BE|nr:copper homeostasis protein CutC [Radiobacillus kanasensis]UFT98704.1 copper homeostasis protein CutC [Radiobacillus kanasensis]